MNMKSFFKKIRYCFFIKQFFITNSNKINKLFDSKLWACFLFSLLALIVYYLSKIDTIVLSDSHIDGAFQSYNGLSRLAGGERVGVDFFLYLGPGLYYALLPFYLLFGSSFSASMLACDFSVELISFIIIFILLRALKIKNNTFYLFFIILTLTLVILKPDMFEPGVSLRIFRDLPSYLPAFLFLFIENKTLEKKLVLMSFTVGLFTTFSPVASVAAIISYGFFVLFLLIKELKKHFIRRLFLMLGSFLFGILMTWFLYDHNGFLGNLEYMFFDIGQNQKWFFSPYSDGYSILGLYIKRYFLLFFLLLCIVLRKKTIENFLILTISLSLFLTGLISSLKGHFDMAYFGMFDFFVSLYILLFFVSFIFSKCKNRLKKKNINLMNFKRNNSIVFMNICVGVLLVFVFLCVHSQYNFKRNFVKKNENFIFVPELDGYLNKENQGTIQYVRENKKLIFLEEYNGIPMAILKQKSVTNVDSIIHAMGGKRYSFQKKIEERKFDIITSSNPEEIIWVNWCMAQSWYFYKNLFLNYKIDYKGHKLLFWKKKKKKLTAIDVNCKIDNKKKSIVINNGKPGFYSIKLNYNFKKNYYLLVDVNLHFELGKNLSLPPHLNSFEFPVNSKGKLDFETIPKMGKNDLTLISCSAEDFTSILPFKQSGWMFKVKEKKI